MKKIFVIAVFLISVLNSYSQEWVWSNQLECDGEVMPTSIVTDDNNNVYLAGYYSGGSLTIGDQTPLANSGDWDGFVCKFNSSGDLLWLNHIASTNRDEIVSLIILGTDLYVAGSFKADLSFNATAAPFVHVNNYDAFIARYDLDGNYQWSTNIFSGSGVERIKDVIYNASTGEFLVSAQFKTEVIYTDASGTQIIPALSSKDLFIATSDLLGVIQDTARHTSSIVNSVYNDINLCQDEGYFLTGDLFGDMYFPSLDTIKGNSDASSDAVVVKLDANLDFLWARKGGAAGYDHVNSSVSDISGNVYLTGQIDGVNVYFDLNDTEQSEGIDALNVDLYVAKYNKTGDLLWVQHNGNIGNDNGYGLVQQENLVQFCGNTTDTVIFNADTLFSSSTIDVNTGFAIYDTDGNEIGAQGIGGLLEDKGQAITFDNNRNTIIAGYFSSTAMDIGDSSYTNTTGTDGFIASYFYPFKSTFDEYQHVTCNGGADGRLIATNYFGVGPYTYDWSASTGTGTFNDSLASGLTAGFYSLTVTDSRTESTTINFTIIEPAPFAITTDSTNITCNGLDNGTLIAGATGNTLPYNYNWTGQNAVPNDSAQSGLEPGKYMLSVTDANGCATTDSVTLTQPDKILFTGTTAEREDPAGSYSGSIDLNVTGGTLPYAYSWEDASGIMTGRVNDTLNNLQEGFYIAHILDGNSCAVDTTVLVPGEIFRVQLLETNAISCYGLSDGSATARIVSGDLGESYSYVFTDSIGTTLTAVNDTIISNLERGWYYVTAQETGGSLRTAIDSLYLSQPDSLILSLSADSVDCFGENTGAITVLRSGGTTPVSYLWSNAATTQSISSLDMGRYTVVATDANSCIATDSADVEQNDSIEITITAIQDISCNGSLNGILQADVSGGTGSYSYLWNDPGLQTTYRATGLGVGTYSVTITDSKSCINNDSESIDEPEVLYLQTIDTNHVTCFGGNDGMIKVGVAGGTAPYTYDWAPPYPADDSLGGLTAQPFPIALTVTDANGCVNDSLSVTIRGPETALTVNEDLDAHVDNACFGETLGSLTVIASGGWNGEYTYSINSTDWQSSPTFSDLGAQQYTVYVRDTNGCVENIDIDVTETAELTIASENVTDNTINVIAVGGTSPLQYTLNGAGSAQSTGLFTDLVNGSYFVEVTDANNCGPVRSGDLVVSVSGLNETLENITSIYPNPSSGLFNLEINVPSNGEFNLEIFSLTGAKVHEKVFFAQANEFKTVNVDLTQQSKGIYLVKVNSIVLQTKLIVE